MKIRLIAVSLVASMLLAAVPALAETTSMTGGGTQTTTTVDTVCLSAASDVLT